MDTPTISLSICDPQHNTLATIEDLPVPIRLEPDGSHMMHVSTHSLQPAMQAALNAFTQAWEHACKETTP